VSVRSRRSVWLERGVVAVCGLVLAVALISLLSGYFTGRDKAAVSGGTEVGLQFADQGDQLLAPGSRRPRYDSNPPTSGAHVPVAVRRDGATLSDDQILGALAAGDIVIVYGTPRAPAGLARVASSLAGPFTPALASAGQAVVLARRPGVSGLLALAWTRMLRVSGPHDPLLAQFVDIYLGQHQAPRLSPHPGG
jgi:hypothetical protein